jgi:hypothetical protein
MVAIASKYHGPTDTRGSCVRATANGNTVTVPWASELDSEANHREACKRLCDKLGWDADRFFGGVMDDHRWAWVPVFPYDWERRQKEVTHAMPPM